MQKKFIFGGLKMTYKTPKGTRDFLPGEADIREEIIRKIEEMFKRYSFKKWDGPAFEYLETLTKKSGEEIIKEIYTFKDKGGRDLGLRFELTSSLARMIASNPNLKKPIKAYSIGKVWRYDSPQQGRYREFLQADADIFGSEKCFCEVELLSMAKGILEELGFNEFYIVLNNRKILESQLECSNISLERKNDVFIALDKLGKIGYEGVKKEFLERGLKLSDFEGFMKYIIIEGSNEEKIAKMKELLKNSEKGIEGLQELEDILRFASQINLSNIVIDYSLVRGLDYYTGPIYEIKIRKGKEVGSIAGGGRYDNLVELFGGQKTPAVGISLGIERIIDLIKEDPVLSARNMPKNSSIFVAYLNRDLFDHAFEITERLRREGICSDIDLAMRSFRKQLDYANEKGYTYVLFVGEEELKNKIYRLKDMKSGKTESLRLEEIIKKLKTSENERNPLSL